MDRRDVDCGFPLERFARRYPRLFALLALLFVVLANGLGCAIDTWGG